MGRRQERSFSVGSLNHVNILMSRGAINITANINSLKDQSFLLHSIKYPFYGPGKVKHKGKQFAWR
jgi:hypothetical protein